MKSSVISKIEETYTVNLMKAIYVELMYKTRELEEVREKQPQDNRWNSQFKLCLYYRTNCNTTINLYHYSWVKDGINHRLKLK